MTQDEIREAVLRALCAVAPEADPATLAPDVSLRDQLDVDSMDLLNFVVGIHERLHVDVPESDYGQLGTLDEIVAYVGARIPAAA